MKCCKYGPGALEPKLNSLSGSPSPFSTCGLYYKQVMIFDGDSSTVNK